MRKVSGLSAILAAAMTCALFAGCVSIPADGQMTLRVEGTEAEEMESLFVTFSEVRILPSEASEDADAEAEVVVLDSPREVDILSAENNVLIESEGVRSDSFNVIVIIVDSARVVLADGTEQDLDLDGQEVRIDQSFDVEEDRVTVVVVQIDTQQAVDADTNVFVFNVDVITVNITIEDAEDDGLLPGDDDGFPVPGEDGDETVFVFVRATPDERFTSLTLTISRIEVHCPPGQTDDDEDGGFDDDNFTSPTPAPTNNTTSPSPTPTNTTGPTPTNNTTAPSPTPTNATTPGGDNGTDEGGWTVLIEGEFTIDLLNFTDEDARAFLDEGEIDASRCTQIRLTLVEATGVLADGTSVIIEVPNPEGRLVQSFELEEDEADTVILVIDLQQSLHESGPGQFRLTPVIGTVEVTVAVQGEPEDVPNETTSPSPTNTTASPSPTNTTAPSPSPTNTTTPTATPTP